MQRFLSLLIASLLPSLAAAQTNSAEQPETAPIIIESVGEKPAAPTKQQIRRSKFKRKMDELGTMEKRASPEKVLDDRGWVQETLQISAPYVHGLQRFARLNPYDLVPRWRAAVRFQAGAYEAFRLGKYHTAVFLTLKAREAAREGYSIAHVTLADPVADTAKEREYASKANPQDAVPFYEAALKALPDSELDPGRSPHTWRTQPILE